MKAGIRQGSGLGPLLFLICINDLPKCLNAGSKPDMFADDTQIATASHDVEVITETLNSDLNNVASWLSANKLTLNNSKTEYMIISSKKRIGLVTSDPVINVGNLKINRVKTTKSLGLMIDESCTKLVRTCRSHLQKGRFRSRNSQESSRDIRFRYLNNYIAIHNSALF